MKRKRKIKEKPKTFNRYLNRILIAAVAAIVITGVVIMIVSAVQDNMTMMFVGIAMLPGASILATPNIVRYALKDNTDWESKFREKRYKLHKAGMLSTVSDMSPYLKKLLWGVRREALWNFFKLMLGVFGILVIRIILIANDVGEANEVDFFIILGVLVFGIPISAYNIASSAYRIRTVKRRQYNAYRTEASGADGLHMWIMDKNDNIYTFDYCRCLGIRPKKVHGTKVILVFVPDEVYLIPDGEQLTDT